jgi:hypothetical protein
VSAMANEIYRDPDLEWLDHVPPVGLVVAPTPDRDAVARMKDQKPRPLHINRRLLRIRIKRRARARSKRHFRVEPFRERSHWRLYAERGTGNHPGPYTVVLDGREACGIEMLKRRVGFLLCLWKRDPAI